MGYKHDHESLLAAAVEAVFDDGIGALSFGRLAKRLGIADRTVVYYFPTKEQLVTETLDAISLRLLVHLEAAFGTEPRPPAELLRSAWPVLTDDDASAVFDVFIELGGLAATGAEPYRAISSSMTLAWLDWLTTLVQARGPERRRAEAAALIARIDGLMMLRSVAGDDVARIAFERLVTG